MIVEGDVVGHLALDGNCIAFLIAERGMDIRRGNRAFQIHHLAMIFTIDGQTVLPDIVDEGDGILDGIVDI